ncbi:MAG: energy transducer TonB, partial [Ectothiorhodospira sp.]
ESASAASPSEREEAGGSARADAGGAAGEDARRDYARQLQAWLERHKRYPRQARFRRQEGTVTVRFVVDRKGRVRSHELVGSSGHPALDREVEAMLERAQPLPEMPEDLPGEGFSVEMPVRFNLR